MTETTNSLPIPAINADEPLRLKCPQCGGGLNLKRRFLGVRGQCVHCQTPLTAVEEEDAVKVICHAAPPSFDPPAAAPETVSHAPVPSLAAPVEVPVIAEPIIPAEAPAAEAVAANEPISGHPWDLPDFDSPAPSGMFPIEEPPSLLGETAPPSFLSSFSESKTPEIEPLLPGREEDNLFSGKIELPSPKTSSPRSEDSISLFGTTEDSPSPFLNETAKTEIQAAWGTQVPNGNHASISPFSTGSAQGGGLGDSLFREKAVKENSLKSAEESSPFGASPFAASPFSSTPFATPAAATPPAPVRQEEDAAVEETEEGDSSKPKRDCQEFVILDGDGRPMRPMSKEEEESFATNFFKYENARTKPTWLMKLRKKLIRMLIFFCVIGAIGAGASFFVPKETLLVWKEKAIKWLEPGMAIFDYLPEKLRPDWLPQTDFGIDAGTDENGQPKKKLNAFEGLDKLKGDVGDMRGAADKQLEELKNF